MKQKDLLKRLRIQPEDLGGPSRLDMLRERIEAADEIEQLQKKVEELKKRIAWMEQHPPNCECRECHIP